MKRTKPGVNLLLNISLKEVVLSRYQKMPVKAGGVIDDWSAGVLKIVGNTVSNNHPSLTNQFH